MEKHFELSDAEFEKQFISCQLSPTIFSHEAHLRLAWLNIEKYGFEQAKEKIQNQLINFVTDIGAKDKYHKTLTIASIYAVAHFMKKSKSDNFKDFNLEFPKLKNNFKELIESHYSFDIFNSAKAREEFIEPDLIPFMQW